MRWGRYSTFKTRMRRRPLLPSLILVAAVLSTCNASFSVISRRQLVFTAILTATATGGSDAFFNPVTPRMAETTIASSPTSSSSSSSSVASIRRSINFINTLSKPYDLNADNDLRTKLLNEMIISGESLPNPANQKTFARVAPGLWNVIYAPHMTSIAIFLNVADLSVQYLLKEDGSIISHARYSLPLLNISGYLSVSGTYNSVNDTICRVNFNEAWIRSFNDNQSCMNIGPYPTIDSVPDSIIKSFIRNIGRYLFVEAVAVFPVSYLDEELIVFDFELLGTRICARKKRDKHILARE